MGIEDLIGTRVPYRTVTAHISHERSTDAGTPAADVVLVTEWEAEPDTLTRIALWPQGDGPATVVLLHWSHYMTADFCIHFDDDARTLFIGGATVAAAIRIDERRVVDQHKVTLFWRFRPEGDYVLELGELDVFLRLRTGEIIASAPVDPPYEITRTPEGIRFDSANYGEQWLRFPR